MNVFSLIGNLTRDPELKYSGEGKAYTKFSVAVPRRFNRNEADFFNCTAFGKQAENVAEYCRKGSKVGVVGQVNIDRKEDRTYTNILVDSVEFLTHKGSQSNNKQDPFQNDGKPIDISNDDLPF
ncbi:single-stranded DNA-binding protein [Paenibacillus sp. D2_2]|uniref:single-stranded DNA-binding protein n=1 Tax=Paenibacillus sp. D2_2 TaxID=3073092 RepID=UPI002814D0E3|nr:single-stranded DNA-binding protein [Paenibacillus sp. D2_2]WMT42808.1 single-stranded DNA-binding protein [Paenibacillus sp. D2_2]